MTHENLMSEEIRRRYNEYAKNASPADFLGQVRRTVHGKPVGAEQIDLIVAAILDGLRIEPSDTVLDLCCGNGFLSDRVFERCSGGTGVDFSDGLIEVAQRHFERLPERRYVLSDVATYVRDAAVDRAYNKALCYGSFPHFTDEAAVSMLRDLRRRFGVTRMFVGNLPDRARLMNFYDERPYVVGIEDDPTSAVGIWRTRLAFSTLAESAGWAVQLRAMPPEFYAAHYRFDAILTPK
jgi:SAM-dependent methyltransferase